MLEIPRRFMDILENDRELQGGVLSASQIFSQLIKDSEFEFFPEYTDHRLDHLNNVLRTCEFLITEESYEYLNAEDITVLVLSVLLHDVGMHITHEGLMSLLKGGLSQRKIEEFDNTNWDMLWGEYLDEVKRFNDEQLIELFGKVVSIGELPEDKDLLSRYDRKIYGEFIRRYHPRMAHEIALYGFPSKENNVIPFASGLNQDMKLLIGILSRSHGMDLRDTFKYLKSNFGKVWRTPKDVKIIFLMVILRIADYLHITSERASDMALNTRNISSTISKKEWDLHKSVKQISNDLSDNEAIYVLAQPMESEIFLKLKFLLNSIQSELDTSWGVLGEVYGSLDRFENLKLKIRRIQSNIDEEDFINKLDYIPKKIMTTSHPDLLKLLIAPLYGDNISYGVRELLQNAIDACRERKSLVNDGYVSEINISLVEENDYGYFIIKDNGIGMNEDIIINYFLTAGASFRNSTFWKNNFTDENNKSMVQRSGKFGVGVFAGFLIGEELEVKTCRLGSNKGFEFKVDMDQKQIDVIKVDSKEVGTEIKIKLTQNTLKSFKKINRYYDTAWFDWYKLEDPQVSINIPDAWFGTSFKNEKYDSGNLKNMLTIYPENYQGIKWHYKEKWSNRSSRSNLICNGIKIPTNYNIKSSVFPSFQYTRTPIIIVNDFDGNLPLTLDRKNIYGVLPFEKELVEDIFKDINAEMLNIEVLEFDSFANFVIKNNNLSHLSINEKETYATKLLKENDLILFKEGYTLPLSYNMGILKVNKVSKVWLNSLENAFINHENQLHGIIFSTDKVNSIDDFKAVMDSDQIGLDEQYKVLSKRLILHKEKFKYLTEAGRLRNGFIKEIEIEYEGNILISIVQGNPPKSELDFNLFEKNAEEFIIYGEYYLDEKITITSDKRKSKNNYYKDIAVQLYQDDVLIPYNKEQRKEKLKFLYELLAPYMKKYE